MNDKVNDAFSGCHPFLNFFTSLWYFVYNVQSASGISTDFIYRSSDVCLSSEWMEKNIKTEFSHNVARSFNCSIIKSAV